MHLGTKDHNSATNQACLILIGISRHFLALLGTSQHLSVTLAFGWKDSRNLRDSQIIVGIHSALFLHQFPITLSSSYHPYTYSLTPALFTSAYLPIAYLSTIVLAPANSTFHPSASVSTAYDNTAGLTNQLCRIYNNTIQFLARTNTTAVSLISSVGFVSIFQLELTQQQPHKSALKDFDINNNS